MAITAVNNLSAEGIAVANQFAKGKQFYSGPTVPNRVEAGRRVYTCAGREISMAASSTFGGFLLEHLRVTIGKPWLKERSRSRSGQKHPLIRLFSHAQQYSAQFHAKIKQEGATHYIQCGAQRELTTLADDIVTLAMIGALPVEMPKRLRHPSEYQGARYELAVAAAFARQGFTIHWFPSSRSTPEFLASHAVTGDRLVVEAKSRHRPSQFIGRALDAEVATIEADVAKLYRQAVSKPTEGLPLVVCIDANVPYRVHSSEPVLGIEGVASSLDRSPLVSEQSPAPEFMLCVTTCGWYYALLSPAFPVRRVSTFPRWTNAAPRNFNTYVAVIQAIYSMYTSPQSNDIAVNADSEQNAQALRPFSYSGKSADK